MDPKMYDVNDVVPAVIHSGSLLKDLLLSQQALLNL